MKRTLPAAERLIFSRRKLLSCLRQWRRQGKRIAFTNGCFDLLHAGHLHYLEKIKSHADRLVVGINSDSSVRRLKKGKGRPIVFEKERALLVAALKPVDGVILFAEPTPLALIQAIRPDLLVKGGDWKLSGVVGADWVRSHGGQVKVIPFLEGHSTTRLIQRIRRA